jgi:hypothetical protein
LGYQTLVALDAANGGLRTVQVSAFLVGGVHYTRARSVIWFSGLNQAGQPQRFVEVFALEPGALKERSLGRIEVPFVAGTTTLHKGDDCHVLAIHNRRDSAATPQLQRRLLFADGVPTDAKDLNGIGRVLFWEPERKAFIVELGSVESAGDAAVQLRELDCAAHLSPLSPSVASRLAQVRKVDRGHYRAPTGDWLIDDPAEDGPPPYFEGPHALVLRGGLSTVLPSAVVCYDPGIGDCWNRAPSGRGWSHSGRHFALRRSHPVGYDFEIYRTDTLDVVHRRRLGANDGFLFIDDDAMYFVARRGRFVREPWGDTLASQSAE